jgi:hypothetical protein
MFIVRLHYEKIRHTHHDRTLRTNDDDEDAIGPGGVRTGRQYLGEPSGSHTTGPHVAY